MCGGESGPAGGADGLAAAVVFVVGGDVADAGSGEGAPRGHAIVEQVIADLKNGPLAHLPSGQFWANSAWLVCASIAFNLTRAAGTLASTFHARVTTGTIRTQLINVPARLARSARRLTLHLPHDWPWQHAWQQLLATSVHGSPLTA